MSLASNSAGGFYQPRESVPSHSHDSIHSDTAPPKTTAAAHAVQRPPASAGHPTYPPDGQYQATTPNPQWGLPVPSTLRQSPPHNQSPSGSHVSLSDQPSPSTPSTMITPYYYETTDSQNADAGDYQQWVDNFHSAQMHYPFQTGHPSPSMVQLPYQEQHPPHASMPASMQPANVMPPVQNHYHFVESQYTAPVHPPQGTGYDRGYTFVNPTRSRGVAARQGPPAANPNSYGAPTSQLLQEQQQAQSASAISPAYQSSMHQPYPSMDGTTGMQQQMYPPQSLDPVSDPHAPQPLRTDLNFSFSASGSESLVPASQSFTPNSDNAGLPSTPSSRPSTGDTRAQLQASSASSVSLTFTPAQVASRPSPPAGQPKGKGKKRPRRNVVEEEDSGSDEEDMQGGTAVPPLKGPDGSATRLPGACTHCKKLKMRCHFPPSENTCHRCKNSGHVCIVEGRKPRNAPNKREYLLAQIRQKDMIIESLLKQLHNPYLATPLSIRSYREATSPSDQNNQNVRDWLDRLEESVRTAGGSGGPSAFGLGSRAEQQESAEEDESESDGEERGGDENEPTERGSVGTVKVDEDEKNQSLPDATVPLGLIAELALGSTGHGKGGKGRKVPKDEDDTDDDNVGVANDAYFLPGPASDLKIRAEIIEKDTPPEIVVHGLVTPDDVDKLFEIFFARLNCHVSVLDPVLHTPATTFKRCPFLFTVVCAVASRYYREKSQIYPIAMHFAKHAAANALITGWKSVELAQAYIILSIYGVPARRWEEDRGWLYTGLAIRIATDLNLHHLPTTKPADEMQEREMINKVRVWMNCYNLDRSTATQFGKPSTIKEDFIVRKSHDWYKMSAYNHPYDIGLCGYTTQLRIVAQFHEEVFSDPDSPTGLNEQLDFHEVTLRHDEELKRYFDEWTRRFAVESDLNDPACAFRSTLLPFFTNYSRLVMYSFGCQQAFRRSTGMQPSDRIFVDKCFESAKAVITSMVDVLAPSGFVRYAPDSHFVFGTFASAFLLKLLKPEFTSQNLITKQQEDEIFQLIHRLIQTLQSPEIAIDEKHTPRLHARFLTGLLSRYKRDVATTGRLHTQPPPPTTQDPYARPPQHFLHQQQHQQHGHQGQQQVFSMTPDGDHAMGTAHSSPDSLLNEPVYEPEAAYAGDDAGPIEFDPAGMSGEEDVLGALRILKTPAYWSDMMTPGFQNQWGSSNTQGIPGIHHSFNTFQATGVV